MLSDEVRRELLARPDWKPKAKGERVHFRCPRHDDHEPSAWQGGGAWGCFSCGFQEPIQSLAEILGIDLGAGDGSYTLEQYADEKGFSAATLRGWGLETAEDRGRAVVRIPYLDEEGQELRARFRSRTGKWWEGRDLPIHLYGRDRLVDAKGGDPVLIVEGESDCHALWSEGVLAVGVPGATAWRADWAEHLRGLVVHVWEEPDQGGAQLVERIVQSFPKARVIQANGAKDPCDLRRVTGADFAPKIRALMAEARPYGSAEPPVAFDVLGPDRFERLLEFQEAPVDAVPTPFPAWNRCCADGGGRQGVARNWHVLAAARTGTGKSILALNVAARAMEAGETVCFLSLEMSQEQVETRLMAIMTGTPVRELEKGRHFRRESFLAAAERFGLCAGRFVTNRAPIYRVDQVTQSIQAIHEIHGARYFVVDYLQLAGNPNDPESITEVSHAVREQARTLGVITFGLSQFNRSTSMLNETPSPNGLMGTSALENDSDQVALIDHSKVEVARAKDDSQTKIGWTTNLNIAKNRHGPVGSIPFLFDTRTLQMRELLDDEIPANLSQEAS